MNAIRNGMIIGFDKDTTSACWYVRWSGKDRSERRTSCRLPAGRYATTSAPFSQHAYVGLALLVDGVRSTKHSYVVPRETLAFGVEEGEL